MYGFGTAGTGDASPLLFGNPHWYWKGPDRFYQAQLTIGNELNVSGVSFLGIPVVLIGFNDNVAWSHTVSTARRFGFFQLTLAAGDPTSYLRDGAPVKMAASTITVQNRTASGMVDVTRTLYKTDMGPLVNLAGLNPALAWNQSTAFVIRDINGENYRTFRNWMRWNQARSLDEFIAIQREGGRHPLGEHRGRGPRQRQGLVRRHGRGAQRVRRPVGLLHHGLRQGRRRGAAGRAVLRRLAQRSATGSPTRTPRRRAPSARRACPTCSATTTSAT